MKAMPAELVDDRWRMACLRGLATGPDGPHALVLVSAGQYLRVPMSSPELARWHDCLGRRVWIRTTDARPSGLRREAPRPGDRDGR